MLRSDGQTRRLLQWLELLRWLQHYEEVQMNKCDHLCRLVTSAEVKCLEGIARITEIHNFGSQTC